MALMLPISFRCSLEGSKRLRGDFEAVLLGFGSTLCSV